MLSVEMPTGYAYEQFDGLKLIRTGIVPELKEVDTTQHGHTIWYLDHIPKDIRCFEHTVRNNAKKNFEWPSTLYLMASFYFYLYHLIK